MIILTPRLLFYWLFIPVLLVWLISLDLPIPQKRSIYMDRYLLTAMPAFVILVAWGGVSLLQRRRWVGIVALSFVVAAQALALRNYYFDPQYAREDWQAALAYVTAQRQAEDVLLLRPNHTLPLATYVGGAFPFEEFPFLFYEDERREYLSQEMGPRMAGVAQDWRRAWLISSVDNTNPHGFPHQRNAALTRVGEEDAIKVWLDAHYVQLGEMSFTGVWITLYDLSQTV